MLIVDNATTSDTMAPISNDLDVSRNGSND